MIFIILFDTDARSCAVDSSSKDRIWLWARSASWLDRRFETAESPAFAPVSAHFF